jgi:hypothetical protein
MTGAHNRRDDVWRDAVLVWNGIVSTAPAPADPHGKPEGRQEAPARIEHLTAHEPLGLEGEALERAVRLEP